MTKGNLHIPSDYNNINTGINISFDTNNNQNVIDTSIQHPAEPLVEQQDTVFSSEMQKQLYRLLGRAAKHTFTTYDCASLEKVLNAKEISAILKKYKFPNEVTGNEVTGNEVTGNEVTGSPEIVLTMIKNANESLKKLDQLKGMDDFAALFDNPEAESKKRLHIQAINAHNSVADMLQFIMNKTMNTEHYEILFELQFKYSARAAEISRWASQMKTLYDNQKQNPASQQEGKSADGFTFDTKASNALAELSAQMHGTADGLAKLFSSNEDVRGFLETLENFANSQETGNITPEEYEILRKQVKEGSVK